MRGDGAGPGISTGSTLIVRDGPSSDPTSRSADRRHDSDGLEGFIAVPWSIVPATAEDRAARRVLDSSSATVVGSIAHADPAA